jgi:predicted HicB family RNase H-like nuclease
MRRIRAGAIVKRGTESVGETAAAGGSDKGRMVHIRLAPELHRKLRLVVAAHDTTLQEWIARTLEDAADRAWPDIAPGAKR